MLVPHDFLNLIRVSRVSSGPPVLLSFVSDPGGYDEDVAIELLQDAADAGHGAATEALEQLQEDRRRTDKLRTPNFDPRKMLTLRQDLVGSTARGFGMPQKSDALPKSYLHPF